MTGDRLTGDEIVAILSAACAAKAKRLRFADLYVEFEGFQELPAMINSPEMMDPELEKVRKALREQAALDDLAYDNPGEFERRMMEGATRKQQE